MTPPAPSSSPRAAQVNDDDTPAAARVSGPPGLLRRDSAPTALLLARSTSTDSWSSSSSSPSSYTSSRPGVQVTIMASPTDASYNTPSTAVPAKSSRRPANIDLTMPSSTSSSVATSPRSPPAFATRPRVPVGTSATTDNLRLGPPPSVLGNPLCAGQQVHPLKTSQGATSGLTSPCFVHNHLDTSLASFLAEERRRQEKVAKSKGKQRSASEATVSDSDSEDDAQSLTRQLAETAVSVREMSKQLGRARVKSTIQSILIITKARDPHLVRLTRELALYLMTTCKTNGKERGAIVYVDGQLRKSKRFDAAGIERDHPELFKPFVNTSRRFSRHNSSTNLPTEATEAKRMNSLARQLANAQMSPINGTTRREPTESGTATPNDEQRVQEEGQLRYWTPEMCTRSPQLFDFVVTLGGDGTVLFASWLFQRIVPPIIPFALGSLGFLTNFDFSDYANVMSTAIADGVRVNLRMRFTCTVYRASSPQSDVKATRKAMRNGKTGEIYLSDIAGKGGWEAIESGAGTTAALERRSSTSNRDREVKCFSTYPVETFEVLNDLVVDRGPSPYVSLLELFGDEHHMTTVQADGLCVSTPTGSTAYSLSAGGSLVHPEIPAILISPICPHTLSFRPMLLPDSMELRICVPYNSRSTAWASFDGRGRVELKQGDHIKITASRYPFPTVCADKQSTDWFHAIGRTLKWNERQRQKSFVVVEEARPREPRASELHADRKEAEAGNDAAVEAPSGVDGRAEEEEHDEEEEDTAYDIDDLSTTSSPEGESRSTSAAGKSGVPHGLVDGASDDDADHRFAAERPHPPRLSSRHLSATKAVSRGEEGDRDDLRASLEDKRRERTISKPKRPASAPVTRFAMSSSGRKAEGKKAEDDRTPTADQSSFEGQRAFAVVGEDESDASVSDYD